MFDFLQCCFSQGGDYSFYCPPSDPIYLRVFVELIFENSFYYPNGFCETCFVVSYLVLTGCHLPLHSVRAFETNQLPASLKRLAWLSRSVDSDNRQHLWRSRC